MRRARQMLLLRTYPLYHPAGPLLSISCEVHKVNLLKSDMLDRTAVEAPSGQGPFQQVKRDARAAPDAVAECRYSLNHLLAPRGVLPREICQSWKVEAVEAGYT